MKRKATERRSDGATKGIQRRPHSREAQVDKRPVKTFRDLIAWQRGMELCKALYLATRQMPDQERFGLTNQMRRAAVSRSSAPLQP